MQEHITRFIKNEETQTADIRRLIREIKEINVCSKACEKNVTDYRYYRTELEGIHRSTSKVLSDTAHYEGKDV